MRKVLICILVAIFSMAAIAQQPASSSTTSSAGSQPLPPNAASREKVVRMLTLIDVKKTTEMTMRAAIQQAKATFAQTFQQQMPDATPEEIKHLTEMLDGVMQDTVGSMHIDEIIEAMVPVYQRHFTNADIDAVLAFYSSPTGQKLLNELPSIMQESMVAVGPIQQKMMQEMMQKISQRTEKMIEEEKKNQKPGNLPQSSRN